jgi:hypothetical protein
MYGISQNYAKENCIVCNGFTLKLYNSPICEYIQKLFGKKYETGNEKRGGGGFKRKRKKEER